MEFSSVYDFWQMSGHGPYVWFSFASSALVLTALLFEARRRNRRARALVMAAIRRRRAEQST